MKMKVLETKGKEVRARKKKNGINSQDTRNYRIKTGKEVLR